jgi:phosphatidylserine/phosphatidylglycerophosphate/cardiolipin synthase-like enzyme
MAYPIRNDNQIEFLLDGEEIIGAILEGFRAVAATAANTPHTYVRLGFWLIQSNMTLGDHDHRHLETIVDQIRDVIVAGFDVEVILWYPGNIFTQMGMTEQVTEHDLLAREIRRIERAQVELWPNQHIGNARVYKERYEGPASGSNHQKFAIFSINGQRTVILGGLNLAQRYFDTIAHKHINTYVDPNREASWHDTAVRLKGPVTDDVEDEWMRRWNRVVDVATSRVSLENLRARLKSRHLEEGATDRTLAWTVTPNATAQTTYAGGAVANVHTGVRSQILLTRQDGSHQTRDILTTVLARIGAATRRIYVENCQLTDPLIARAIYERMAAQPGLQVAIVTNPDRLGRGYLTRRAWLHMALRHPSCRQVAYALDPTTPAVVDRGGGPDPAWQIRDRYRATHPEEFQWLEEDDISFIGPNGETLTRKFHQILGLDVDFHMYTPAVHLGWFQENGKPGFRPLSIHSKLMVIDDWVACGSSNWTFRSMQYDGEILSMSESPALADEVLSRTFAHYDTVNNVTMDNIEATALANADAVIAEAATGFWRKVNPDAFMLMPLENELYLFGPGLALYWRDDSPSHGALDRILHPQQRFRGLTTDLPNWRWW